MGRGEVGKAERSRQGERGPRNLRTKRRYPKKNSIPLPQFNLSSLPGGRLRGGWDAPIVRRRLRLAQGDLARRSLVDARCLPPPTHTSPPIQSLPPSKGETKRGVGAARVCRRWFWAGASLRAQRTLVDARGLSPPNHTSSPIQSLPPSRGETKRGVGAARVRRRWFGRVRRWVGNERWWTLATSHPPPSLPPKRGEGLNWGGE